MCRLFLIRHLIKDSFLNIQEQNILHIKNARDYSIHLQLYLSLDILHCHK